MLNLLAAAGVTYRWRHRVPAASMVVAALAVAAAVVLAVPAFAVDLDGLTTARQFVGQEVVFHGSSPYGRLVVTRSGNQFNFIQNGLPLFSTGNVEQVEETVHYAMAQRPNARGVLLISGGVSGTAREMLKYGPDAVDYVEIDPLILRRRRRCCSRSAGRPADPPSRPMGRFFVRQTEGRYDCDPRRARAVHVAAQSLLHAGILRRRSARRLRPGGVLCFPLGPYDGYVPPAGPAAGHRLSDAPRRSSATCC